MIIDDTIKCPGFGRKVPSYLRAVPKPTWTGASNDTRLLSGHQRINAHFGAAWKADSSKIHQGARHRSNLKRSKRQGHQTPDSKVIHPFPERLPSILGQLSNRSYEPHMAPCVFQNCGLVGTQSSPEATGCCHDSSTGISDSLRTVSRYAEGGGLAVEARLFPRRGDHDSRQGEARWPMEVAPLRPGHPRSAFSMAVLSCGSCGKLSTVSSQDEDTRRFADLHYVHGHEDDDRFLSFPGQRTRQGRHRTFAEGYRPSILESYSTSYIRKRTLDARRPDRDDIDFARSSDKRSDSQIHRRKTFGHGLGVDEIAIFGEGKR